MSEQIKNISEHAPDPTIRQEIAVREGWLEPNGTCHNVPESHAEWAAEYLNIKLPPPPSSEFIRGAIVVDDKLFEKGWVKIAIKPDYNILYFQTKNVPWQKLTHKQRSWLYNIATHYNTLSNDKLEVSDQPRENPLEIQFGNSGRYIKQTDLKESKLLYFNILKNVLLERMTFNDLLSSSESGRKHRADRDVNARPIRVLTMDDDEAWAFNYKSSPSTTGQRWHGYIRFFKDNVAQLENAGDIECMVDCDCPDYRYRYAYNNAQADAGIIGKHPDWKYGNSNNGQKWRPRSQGGVGDYGIGLCKHLIALAKYLDTNVTSDAPNPDDKTPKPSTSQVSKKPVIPSKPTTNAPSPDDGYSDSRTGSLQENVGNLYKKIDQFVKSNPEFDINV